MSKLLTAFIILLLTTNSYAEINFDLLCGEYKNKVAVEMEIIPTIVLEGMKRLDTDEREIVFPTGQIRAKDINDFCSAASSTPRYK